MRNTNDEAESAGHQNVQYLTFSYSNLSSNGYFTTTSNQLYATEWKAYATVFLKNSKVLSRSNMCCSSWSLRRDFRQR